MVNLKPNKVFLQNIAIILTNLDQSLTVPPPTNPRVTFILELVLITLRRI